MTLGSGPRPERRTHGRSTFPVAAVRPRLTGTSTPPQSPKRAPNQPEVTGSRRGITAEKVTFAGLSCASTRRVDSLNIVVSPVRVRVSPSQEVPANRPISCRNVATRHERLRATHAGRVPNEVPMTTPCRSEALTAASDVAP
jgi:hypothetical protein